MIVVGVPSVRQPDWRLVDSILGLRMEGPWLFRRVPGYGGVDHACNELARIVVEDGHDWLVIVGDDAVLHPMTVQRLLSWNRPVVAALSFMRYAPFPPTVFVEDEDEAGDGDLMVDVAGVRAWLREHPELMDRNRPVVLEPAPDDSLVAVAAAGTHCMAIHRRVLEEMLPPWFARNEETAGEDLYFCKQVRRAGFDILVDRSLVAGHQAGNWSLGPLDFCAWDMITRWDGERQRPEAIVALEMVGKTKA